MQTLKEPTPSFRPFPVQCSVYRRFVQRFANILTSVNEMQKTMTPSEFDDLKYEQSAAYQSFKDVLENPPILALRKANKPYIVDMDASATHEGCDFLQNQYPPRPTNQWAVRAAR